MKHLGTQMLESRRLVLRPFRPSDAQAMYDNWASDPEVTKFLSWPTYKSVDTSHTILARWEQQYPRQDYYQWAIERKELGQPIGSIAVVHLDEQVDTAEIGYCIGRPWWGQGLMTEALTAVMTFLFEKVGVQRIEAGHDPNNPASGAVMRKCGMQQEAILRRRIRSNQGITDVALYAALKEDR